jgi:lipid-binding SYLF domain-containing protein
VLLVQLLRAEVEALLQVHPELRRGPERRGEAKRGVGGDGALSNGAAGTCRALARALRERGPMSTLRHGFVLLVFAALALLSPRPAAATSASTIDAKSTAALQQLYAANPKAKLLGEHAKAILIFPVITKAGFVVGGQSGSGALRKSGQTAGYYNVSAASVGLQAGGQQFAYALFFMNDAALAYLDKSGGWEVGTGPTLVAVDQGVATSLTTTTMKADIYAVTFGQKGLMGGLGLQGSKITRIHPDK